MPEITAAPTTLGKGVDYPSGGTPTPEVLDAIPRAQSAARKRFGAPRGEGVDVWNAYELVYLQGPKRKVRAAALEMRVPSTSPCLVESKSFKLYLFSLRRCQFAGDKELLETIAADLETVLGAVPQLALDPPRLPRAEADFDRVLPIFAPGPAETTAEEALAAASAGNGTHRHGGEGAPVKAVHVLVPGYMSLCPVTGQPDFADVEIYYKGPPLNWSGVADYFARKFEHQVRVPGGVGNPRVPRTPLLTQTAARPPLSPGVSRGVCGDVLRPRAGDAAGRQGPAGAILLHKARGNRHQPRPGLRLRARGRELPAPAAVT